MVNGSAFSRENRVMIKDLKENIVEIKGDVGNINEKITDLSNHYSRRAPVWATVAISILCSLLGATVTVLAMKI